MYTGDKNSCRSTIHGGSTLQQFKVKLHDVCSSYCAISKRRTGFVRD